MAVIACKHQRTGQASFSLENRSSYKVDFWVDTNTPMPPTSVYNGALTVGGANLGPDHLPAMGDVYSYLGVTDPGAYALSADMSLREMNVLNWQVTVTYGKLPPGSNPADQNPDPMLRPVKYNLEPFEEQKTIEKDRLGAAIVNAVGDEFDTALEDSEVYLVLVAEKNYATLQEVIDLGLTYHRTTNSAPFHGAPARTVRFLPVQSTQAQFENGISYYTVQLRFVFNPGTWDRELLDRGRRYRQAAGLPPTDLDANNLPIAAPVKLAANGTLLAEGAAPHFVKVEYLPEKDYNLIGV